MNESDDTKVICPNCVHQFRAIPLDVQAELAAATVRLKECEKDAQRLTTDLLNWKNSVADIMLFARTNETSATIANDKQPSDYKQGLMKAFGDTADYARVKIDYRAAIDAALAQGK